MVSTEFTKLLSLCFAAYVTGITPRCRYPVCTMLFQSLASVVVGLECILRFTPDIYCDTMGAAFTYPAAYYLAGAKVIAYVHYPIISTVRTIIVERVNYDCPDIFVNHDATYCTCVCITGYVK